MIKRLAQCVREYKKDSILSPVFVSLEVLMEVLMPFLTARLIDEGIEKGNMSMILKIGLLLLVLAAASLVFGTLAGARAARASAGFAKNLRQDMFYNVQRFSFSNIDRFSTSSIVTRLTTDVSYVQMAYQMIIRVAVRSPVMLIFSIVMAFSVNSELALVFVPILPVLGVGLWLIMSRAHPIFKRVFKTYDNLNRVVQENLSGVRVVKSFVRQEHEKEKFGAVSQEIYNDFSKAEKLLAFNMPLMQLCIYTCMILASWFGAKLIVGGSMSTGDLMSLITYAMQILMSLMMISMIFVMLIISRASAERIAEMLDEKSDIENPAHAVDRVDSGAVDFEGVSFGYGSEEGSPLCLMDVDLHIPSGATVGILGGTGSAKSSLVQLIPRLYDAKKGTVKVGGVDVKDYDLNTLRDSVAMVLQKNVLFSGTIRENLRWGDPDATDEELERACRLAQAHDFITAFPDGYDTYIEQGGTNVSGGQKQRLCIARALLKKPRILILDDSTSAVDTATDAGIRRALKEEIPDTTKFIIAQRVASVEDADIILVMDNGRVVAQGDHATLMQTSHIYREVYESQRKGGEENV